MADEPLRPDAELNPPTPLGEASSPEPSTPTLLDLAIDRSWLEDARPEPPVAHEASGDRQPAQPSRLGWLSPRSSTDDSIEELATPDTVPVDLTPDPIWKTWLKTGLAFTASAALSYLILTLPSQVVKAAYFVEHFGETAAPAKIIDGPATTGNFADVVRPGLSFSVPPETLPSTSQTPSTHGSDLTNLGDNQLSMPKINVRAPIIWDSSFDEPTMLANLQKGIVHYGGTDRPAGDRGNVFLTGHSSYYWWDKGQYKTVFALLGNLTTGDQVALTYAGQVYVYEVYESVVVKPSQVEVLNTSATPIVSLMTCTPVGTSLNRLIVRAKLVGVFNQSAGANRATSVRSSTETAEPSPTQKPDSSNQPATEPNQTLELLPGR